MEDNRPVDTFVRDVRYVLDDFQDICTGCVMNVSSAANSLQPESITIAFKMQAGIIDPCRRKDPSDETFDYRELLDDVYRGQEKHCCDSVKSCYDSVDQTLINIRLQGALKQNMYQACRRMDEELQTVNSCVDTTFGLCYKINTSVLESDFNDFKQKFLTEFDKHCANLPPERTIATTLTPSTKSTPTKQTKRTTTRGTTLTKSTSTTAAVTTAVNATTEHGETTKFVTTIVNVTTKDGETTESSDERKDSTPMTTKADTTTHTNITITDHVVTTDGLTNSTVTAFQTSKAITNAHEATNNVTEPTKNQTTIVPTISTSANSTTVEPFKDATDANIQNPPSDNTVIIVSAVCSGIVLILAVVIFLVIIMRKKGFMKKCGDCQSCIKGIPCKLFQRDKPQPGPDDEIYAEIDDTFMQAVYQFEKKKDPQPNLKNRVQNNSHDNVCYSAADDDVITSSKSRGPTLQLGTRHLRQNTKQNIYYTSNQLMGNLERSDKKDFMLSHPTFTDPRKIDPVDEYVQISEKYESIETTYDKPKHQNKIVPNVSEEHGKVEKNEYDHIVTTQGEEVYSEVDYINSGVTQNKDHLYRNEIGKDYEITQSRF